MSETLNSKSWLAKHEGNRSFQYLILFMESFSIDVFSSYIRKVELLKKKNILLKSRMTKYKLDSPIESFFLLIKCC